MAEVLLEGKADAVLAASIFHFGDIHRRRRETIFGEAEHSGAGSRRLSHGLVKEREVPPKEIDRAIARKLKYEAAPSRHTHEEIPCYDYETQIHNRRC